MAKKDFYQALGITKGASEADIKSAYRKLARQYHPDVDKSTNAAAKFKEVSEAYQVLSDPQKKKTYDQFGHAAFDQNAGFGAGGPFGGGFRNYSYSRQGNPDVKFDFGGFTDPFDLFEQIFGNMSGFSDSYSRKPTYQMEISFEEAVTGTTKQIELDQNGARKQLTIKVPAGVDNGTKVRYENIDIIFRVMNHPEFLREGPDIFSDTTLSVPQIILGDVIEVKTVWGKVKLKVPPGAEPGSLVRVKDKGMPRLGGGKGDHYVRVKLEVPKKLSSEEKTLYEKLASLKSKKKNWF